MRVLMIAVLAWFAVAVCAAMPVGAAEAAPKPPDIGSFFQNSSFSGAHLSPNGRHLAIRIASKTSRATLAVLDLSTMKLNTVGSMRYVDLGRFAWVNDERLVYTLTDLHLAEAEIVSARGLYAVNRDGSGQRELVDRHGIGSEDLRILHANTQFMQTSPAKDSDDVFVWRPESWQGNELSHILFQRVNSRSGRTVTLDVPTNTVRTLLDKQGNARVIITREGEMLAVMFNDPATGKWRKLTEFHWSDEGFEPLLYGPDGVLYVRANKGRDKTALYRYDLAANKLEDKPLVVSDQFDVDGELITDGNKVLGFRYEIDAEVTTWFDPVMQASQKEIDALLGATTNRISRGMRSETPFLLVDAFSDVQPHVYYLYNTETRKLSKLGAANADIDPRRMSIKDMVRYKARDGLEIPAYLTLPAGGTGKNLPMVVLVHGGPWVRGGAWEFDREVQFLASRGYAVLEPEYRGSTGFGTRHFRAGWKQWGLAMQDDIADGAKWAIAQGYADPKRICIAGASYGGYSALMGLINDPDLFKCGINWVGVTDIDMLYSVRWSDSSVSEQKFGLPLLVGDRKKDEAQFRKTSPLHNAARVRQPLLMAYGGADERVPLVHGTRFRDAVKPTNPNVEWVVYGEEGHGWALLETRLDFWSRVEKFLERNIGKP
jgi:dipeptidyl aminopeptidase/acylaminoacyl peptidase